MQGHTYEEETLAELQVPASAPKPPAAGELSWVMMMMMMMMMSVDEKSESEQI